MRVYFILLFLLAFKLCLCQETSIINYTIDDGLPTNMIYGVVQDEEGFMWFGSDSGLIRYDGYEFTTYALDDGLPDTEILKFFKDSQNRIWFYTLNGKVGYLHQGSIYSAKNTPWLESLNLEGRITSIIESDGSIFFSSVQSKIKILNQKVIHEIDLSPTRKISLCKCDNKVYALSLHKIFELADDYTTVELVELNELIDFTYPTCHNGKIYSFRRGEYKKKLSITNIKDSIALHFSDREEKTYNLEKHQNRLFLFSPEAIRSSTLKDPNQFRIYAQLNSITSLQFDNEGNTWFTSLKNGIYFQPKTSLKLKLNAKNVTALNAEGSKMLVANGHKFLNEIYNESTIKKSNWTYPNRANFITRDSTGKLLVGTNAALYHDFKRISPGAISLALLDSSQIVVGGRNYFTYGGIEDLEENYTLFSGHIHSIINHNGSVYFGSDLGLYQFIDDSVFKVSTSPLFNSRVTDMQSGLVKGIWMTIDGNGLVQLYDNKIFQISEADGLVSNACNKLLINDSVLWVSTPKGLNKVEWIEKSLSITLLDKSDGLKDYKINDLEVFNDSIYLATDIGLYAFPANIKLDEPNNFKLYVDEVIVDNKNYEGGSLTHDTKSISINFKALLYRNHSSLEYQYQLTLLNESTTSDSWVNTKNNQINFSSLEPANYVLFVRAKTKNSKWSLPIKYEFEISPAFWQRLSFQIPLITFIVIMLFIGIQRYYRGKSFKKELERAKTQAEIKALKAQINPHFLFNALNSIQSFVLEGDLESSDTYLVKYGRLIRKVLDHSDKLTVTLSDEIGMLDLYVALEKLRLDKGFDYKVNIDQDIDPNQIKVPSMVIQPFIENAIWHGISFKKGKREIRIEIAKLENHLQILILDNGVGFEKEKMNSKHASKGTRLVSERLALLGTINGIVSNFEISSIPGQGTEVKLTFPSTLN